MLPFTLQTPIWNFINMISTYLAEICDFLIFIGQVSGVIVVLAGAILWFTETNPGRGKHLVLSGIVLLVVVQYFVMFSPSFVLV